MIGSIEFSVDGKAYTLAFRTAAMKAYQREAGETVIDAFQAVEGDAGNVVRLGNLFRFACSPAISEAEADALMDELGLAETYRLVGDAAKVAFEGLADPNSQSQAAE